MATLNCEDYFIQGLDITCLHLSTIGSKHSVKMTVIDYLKRDKLAFCSRFFIHDKNPGDQSGALAARRLHRFKTDRQLSNCER